MLSWVLTLACAAGAAAAPLQTAPMREPAAVLERAAALGPLAQADPAALAEVSAQLEALRAVAPELPEPVRQAVLDRAREAREETARRRLAAYEGAVRQAGWERGDWDEVSRLADAAASDAPARDVLEDHLADRALLETGRRAAAARRWRERLAASDRPLATLRRLLRAPLPAEDARRLAQLARYVPGLRPESTFGPHWALEYETGTMRAGGWAAHVDAGAPAALAVNLLPSGDFHWFKTAVHEAFHQSDAGYRRGEAALRLLFGRRRGEALFRALIEGYTELRTWRALDRLLTEAEAGAGGVAAEFKAAAQAEPFARYGRFGEGDQTLSARMRRQLEANWDPLLELWRPTAYAPYVKAVESVSSVPGGREALDALVGRGEAGPLVRALGRDRLEAAADAADVEAGLSDPDWRPGKEKDPLAAGAASMGMTSWLAGKIADALAGRFDAADAAAMRAVSALVLHELSLQAEGPTGWVDYGAMRLVDLERYRGAADAAELRRLVREDYRAAVRRRNQIYNDAW